MSAKTTNYWATEPEYIKLMNFLVEKLKNEKSPLSGRAQVASEFKEKSGSPEAIGCLIGRLRVLHLRIHQPDTIDMDTKAMIMFGLGASVDAEFLKVLKNHAKFVLLDDRQRIIEYKTKGGGLELEGTHDGERALRSNPKRKNDEPSPNSSKRPKQPSEPQSCDNAPNENSSLREVKQEPSDSPACLVNPNPATPKVQNTVPSDAPIKIELEAPVKTEPEEEKEDGDSSVEIISVVQPRKKKTRDGSTTVNSSATKTTESQKKNDAPVKTELEETETEKRKSALETIPPAITPNAPVKTEEPEISIIKAKIKQKKPVKVEEKRTQEESAEVNSSARDGSSKITEQPVKVETQEKRTQEGSTTANSSATRITEYSGLRSYYKDAGLQEFFQEDTTSTRSPTTHIKPAAVNVPIRDIPLPASPVFSFSPVLAPFNYFWPNNNFWPNSNTTSSPTTRLNLADAWNPTKIRPPIPASSSTRTSTIPAPTAVPLNTNSSHTTRLNHADAWNPTKTKPTPASSVASAPTVPAPTVVPLNTNRRPTSHINHLDARNPIKEKPIPASSSTRTATVPAPTTVSLNTNRCPTSQINLIDARNPIKEKPIPASSAIKAPTVPTPSSTNRSSTAHINLLDARNPIKEKPVNSATAVSASSNTTRSTTTTRPNLADASNPTKVKPTPASSAVSAPTVPAPAAVPSNTNRPQNTHIKFLEMMQSLVHAMDTPSLWKVQEGIEKRIENSGKNMKIIKHEEIAVTMDFLIVKLEKNCSYSKNKAAGLLSLRGFLRLLRTVINTSKLQGMEAILERLRKKIEEPDIWEKNITQKQLRKYLQFALGMVDY